MKRRRKRRSAKKYYERLSVKQKEKLAEVEKLAKELMAKHGVSHYKFRFGISRTYAGLCSSDTITINMSYAIKNSIDEIRNTILHEIAHAIVGTTIGHRKEWQEKAKELGVTWTINYRK